MRKVIILTAIVALSCATISVPGETGADKNLQRDIIKHIGIYEVAAGGSSRPQILNTKNLAVEGNSVQERWTVKRGDQEILYIITLAPDGKGGTWISVKGEDW